MLAEFEKKLVGVVEKVVPSVVSIATTRLARDQLSRPVPVQGQGSGVVLTEEGYVVTNAHVIAGARDVEVILSDGRQFKAVVVGESRLRDLAVLKIEAENLKAIELGDSEFLVDALEKWAFDSKCSPLVSSGTDTRYADSRVATDILQYGSRPDSHP